MKLVILEGLMAREDGFGEAATKEEAMTVALAGIHEMSKEENGCGHCTGCVNDMWAVTADRVTITELEDRFEVDFIDPR